jgi:hypothetical protein
MIYNKLSILFLFLVVNLYSQIASDPVQGSISGGVVVSTNSFPKSRIVQLMIERSTKNKIATKINLQAFNYL